MSAGYGTKEGVGVAVSTPPAYSPAAAPPRTISRRLQDATPAALLVSYFVFSIALYTILDDEARKVFWFLYLTIATLVAGATALEAYDGLTPLREARKALAKADDGVVKFKTSDDELPCLHLIFDVDGGEVPRGLAATGPHFAHAVQYPLDKLFVTVLRKAQPGQPDATIEFTGGPEVHNSTRVLTVPITAAATRPARVAYCLALDAPESDVAVTAVFAGHEGPHPHAPRHAVERLVQDVKIDIVQGRSILVPAGGRSGIFAVLSCLWGDTTNALLQPGRSLTWDLTVPNETNAYWRTDALRAAATARATVGHDALDLQWSALARKARAAWDLQVIAFAPCPTSAAAYARLLVLRARQLALATARYSTLAIIGHRGAEARGDKKMSLKVRAAVVYTLPILRLVSHAILQYLSMALAILFVDAPGSVSEFSRTIYFPYPISEWFIILGLISLVATVAMIYKARSEFVALWTAPLFLVAYPFLLVFEAITDVYGQADALVR